MEGSPRLGRSKAAHPAVGLLESGFGAHGCSLPPTKSPCFLSRMGSEQNPALNDGILAWKGTRPVLRDDEGRREGDARLTCHRTSTYTSSWAWARMKRAEGRPWAVCGLAAEAGHGSGGLGVWLDLA